MLSNRSTTIAGDFFPKGKKGSCIRKSRKAKAKAKPPRKRGGDPSRIYLVDQVDKDLTLASRYRKPVRKYYDCDRSTTSLTRLPKGGNGYAKLGIYSDVELSQVITPSFGSAFNKASRIFGLISKDKHFSYALMCVSVCGMNAHDFRSLMRIRDLWVRGCRTQYKKSIINFSYCLPRFGRRVVEARRLERQVDVMW